MKNIVSHFKGLFCTLAARQMQLELLRQREARISQD